LLKSIWLLFCSRAALIAENLFLRKQLAMFQERKKTPRPASRAARLAMISLARFFQLARCSGIPEPPQAKVSAGPH
jgi:hypothetical protein